jgi:hypothetical protein
MNALRTSIGEEEFDGNIEYKDSNGLVVKDLKNSLSKLGEEIYNKEQFLEVNSNLLNSLMYFINIREKDDFCLKGGYKNYNIEFCFQGKIEAFGYNNRRWNRINLG